MTMILYINTTANDLVEIGVKNKNKFIPTPKTTGVSSNPLQPIHRSGGKSEYQGRKSMVWEFICKKKFSSRRTQAEKLLPSIAKLLKANQLKLSDLKGIEAANRGGSFTSLRIGAVTANALGYALAIPVKGENGRAEKFKSKRLNFNLVKPRYDSEPKITAKKIKN